MRRTFASEIDIPGARLHVTVTGEGAAVVVIHPGITDSWMWADQLEQFTAAHRIVSYNVRGFGRSTIPVDEYAHHQDLR